MEFFTPLAEVLDSSLDGLVRGMKSDATIYAGGEHLTKFTLAEFRQTSSIVNGATSTNYERDEFFLTADYDSIVVKEHDNERTNVTFSFRLKSSLVIQYTRYPASFLEALTKIGGLLALFKIASLLNLFHFMRFEKRLNDSYD